MAVGLVRSPSARNVDSSAAMNPPPFSPMNAMNKPMPMPMARLRDTGMASMTAFTQAAKHQQQDEDAFQEHDGHGHAPVHAEAEAQRIGDDGVDAHPGGERDGTVREQAHRRPS